MFRFLKEYTIVNCRLFIRMFGSIYYRHPDILLQSFHDMNEAYSDVLPALSPVKKFISQIYIALFGIPEIGFQVRGMYFNKAIRTLKGRQLNNILDVGSGIGCYSFLLSMMFPGSQVTGWEIDRSKLAFSKKVRDERQSVNVEFMYKDITKTPKQMSTFDAIVIIDVLEHIKEYKAALSNVYAVLAKGGYVYIHVPQIKQRRFFRSFSSWEHSDHVREGFESKILVRNLQSLGFHVERTWNSFGFFGSLAWELNHLFLKRSSVLAAATYPLIYLLSVVDGMITNKRGLGLSILAKKI